MRKRFRWRALTAMGAALMLCGTLMTAGSGRAEAAVSCKVVYGKNDWGSGFTTNIEITNTGDAVNGWTLKYSYSGNQRLVSGWNGRWSQSGQEITVQNEAWNGSLASGARINVGAQFTYSGTNADPASFTLNGVRCNETAGPPTVALTSPAAGATFSLGGTVPLAADARAADGATISKVEFFNQDGELGEDATAPYTLNWQPRTAGNHSVYARATDSNGSTAESTPVGITVVQQASVVASPGTLTVAQGDTVTYGVRLSEQPSGNVVVRTARTSGNSGLSVTGGESLTFTPQNWSTAQQVEITAAATGTGEATFTSSATGFASAEVKVTQVDATTGTYVERFLDQYNKIKDPANGYFSPEGIPYHSVETFMVEAPDHGHETTSEAYSYLIWLEAMYGKVTQNWGPFNASWALMEKYMIPTREDQPTNSYYQPNSPATYAPEHPEPDDYPSQIDPSVPTGDDPIAGELKSAYGTDDIYGMHWLQDVDNVYGYGNTPGGGCEEGPDAEGPSYINTYQRGPQESVFETIPQPTCDRFAYGGPNGYLDLFIKDSSYARQWKFTNAPDADARAIQAAYWADVWAKEQGKGGEVAATVAKAGKLGDYLRYAFFDKYFKRIGDCYPASSCPGASGKASAHYLLSWYYAWGGSLDGSGGWAWRIGDGASHFGYQNPMAAYALVNNPAMAPKGATAKADWQASLTRQLQLYKWLQSAEGAIAGGVTNSWGGSYSTPPAGLPKFFGMAYDWQPVYHDPPSNNWFGFQVWSLQRVAELYNATGNADAKTILDKWVSWVLPHISADPATGEYRIPSTLRWSGQPDANWSSSTGMPPANTGLHVSVVDYTQDVGTTAALARTLTAYAARSGNAQARTAAKNLLDAMWKHQDTQGVSVPEPKSDYQRVNDPVYVPPGWSGRMPNGDPINSSSTFMSIRSFYEDDPDYERVWAYATGASSTVPVFRYHRFWAQADIAMAMADYGRLFEE
ncbi:glycoside hydrolase family 48 protein [Thermomonospora cellulosilytica]|uniref:Plastocyanin n=1 Tax=Thermomonospora cellulosilytica TaxID=1411118 RepID=A0A7W3MTL0_9ACTN|nr:glycoside hydrolase family 48 protein [Thermomonospora cellulosilytica]MBA9001608.1 plastocyanin [Thermomonospora cellulosilytica]